MRRSEDGPVGLPAQLRRLNMILDPDEVKKVRPDGAVPGGDGTEVLPGPQYEFTMQKS